MLVVTTKVDQSIRIGDDVEVIIVGVEGSKVKLGIVAPPQLTIRRLKSKKKSSPIGEPGVGH